MKDVGIDYDEGLLVLVFLLKVRDSLYCMEMKMLLVVVLVVSFILSWGRFMLYDFMYIVVLLAIYDDCDILMIDLEVFDVIVDIIYDIV